MDQEQLESALREGIMQRNRLNDNLVQLLTQSDERMKKTNDMVSLISHTLDTITAEYSKHLDSLRVCRENQQRIIEKQQDEIHQLNEEIRTEHKRYEELVNKVLIRPNISMKQ